MEADKQVITTMLQARQRGRRLSGGAEAIVVFRVLIEGLRRQGLLQQPLAIVQVEQTKCFDQ